MKTIGRDTSEKTEIERQAENTINTEDTSRKIFSSLRLKNREKGVLEEIDTENQTGSLNREENDTYKMERVEDRLADLFPKDL